jgi:hypothetical protein
MTEVCYVVTPFGLKTDLSGALIDFDALYLEVLKPTISDAGYTPVRGDEELTGGTVYRAIMERVILSPLAVFDVTTANPNVLYELGIRHMARRSGTVVLFAAGERMPYDLAHLQVIMYRISQGKPENPAELRATLAKRLMEAHRESADSPIHQMFDGVNVEITHKAKVVRAENQTADQRRQLTEAKLHGLSALMEFETSLGDLADVDSSLLTDLFTSYRANSGWKQMIDLARRMPSEVAATVMIQEQLALALNRVHRGEEAEKILIDLLQTRGPSGETYGILGRIYKDRWEKAQTSGQRFLASALLDKAIDTYVKGFEADWRDPYPGLNAVTLMELRDPPDPRRLELLPVLTFAVRRRIAARPDYWEYATLLELAVLAKDADMAWAALPNVLTSMRAKWEVETTLRNVRILEQALAKRGEEAPPWLETIIEALQSAAA